MAFSLNETTLLSAITGGSLTSILTSVIEPGYSITYNTSNIAGPDIAASDVFVPTNWIGVELIGESGIVSGPIEKGSYTSFNKVYRPREIRVGFTVEGWTGYSGAIPNITNFSTLSRTGILSILETMRTGTYTYDIETPDTVYKSFDLTRYDYQISSGNGVTLLKVNAVFQEVLQVADTSVNTAASTNKNSNTGSAVTTVQTSSITSDVTLDQVKTAWASSTGTLSSALSATADYAVSEINSAVDAAAESWSQSSTSVSNQIKSAVSQLLKTVT